MSPEDFVALAHAACERSKVRQDAAGRRWPLFAKHARWSYDDESSTLRFYDSERGPALIADVTVTGSFSKRSNTWMWTWANDDYSAAARVAIEPVRVFGEVRGIPKLADACWAAQEVDGWEVTQIAGDLLGAEAIYRVPIEHLLVFMLLRNFRVADG